MTRLPSTQHPPREPAGIASRTLIDDLLAQQQELTAIDQFARAHDAREIRNHSYRNLLPATPPAPGRQYAFEVNLDQCSGCKACVSACHSLNGLDDNETWRSVGLLIDVPNAYDARRRIRQGFQQHVTSACHHCVDPACLNGCPVLAYDKDPLTGIVRHLDDQCIGCQYCVMMCPYEVPQYSKARGIVRKCDMCHSRLAVSEAPACAQACPTSAITITIVEHAKIRGNYRPLSPFNLPADTLAKTARRNSFLNASPNPAITLPTTRFVTSRALPEELYGGDHSVVRRSEPHLPLVILLTLSQLAVGASIAAVVVKPALPLLLIAPVISPIALAAGALHLGQPRKAWRSFLGWHKSWFSREVIAMTAFVFLSLLAATACLLPGTQPFEKFLAPFAGLVGLLAVTCSAMIYVETRREFWNATRSFSKFYGTTCLLGSAVTLATFAFTTAGLSSLAGAAATLAAVTVAKLTCERLIFTHLTDEETLVQTPVNKTARLLAGELNGFVRARIVCAVLGGVVLPIFILLQSAAGTSTIQVLSIATLLLCLAGEFIERHLYFIAVVTVKMPGGLAP